METINIISIITIAFLGSFGHCVGMCGGIVIAYSSKIKSSNKIQQFLNHISYSLGRVTTYTILGAIFGAIGGVVTFSNSANGILWILTGSIMLLAGLSMLGKIKFLTVIEHSFLSSTWYRNNFQTLISQDGKFNLYLLGLLNGLLPCGFVYFFAITSATTGSPLYGALVMFIFGLSTIPALLSLGFFITIFKETKLREKVLKIASIFIFIYGIYTIYNGYQYLVNPERTVLQCH